MIWLCEKPEKGWTFCDGREMNIGQNQALFALLGSHFGTDKTKTFNLPDMRGRVPVGAGTLGEHTYLIGATGGVEKISETFVIPVPEHTHQATFTPGATVPRAEIKIPVSTATTGGTTSNSPKGNYLARTTGGVNGYLTATVTGETGELKGIRGKGRGIEGGDVIVTPLDGPSEAKLDIDVIQPYLALNFLICTEGIYPEPTKRNDGVVEPRPEADATLGEIKLSAIPYDHGGWVLCDGRLLTIRGNEPLFSVLGGLYGGDGKNDFALPNMSGRLPRSNNFGFLGESGGGTNFQVKSTFLVPEHDHQAEFVPKPLDKVRLEVSEVTAGRTYSPAGNYLGVIASGTMYRNAPTANTYLKGVSGGDGAGITGGTVKIEPAGTADAKIEKTIDIRQPYLTLNYFICVNGDLPQRE